MVDWRGVEPPIPENWRGYAVFVAKGYAVLLSVVWLLVVGLLVAGYVVGPAPTPDDETPTVDFEEAPEDVVADALAQLEDRDHTLEKHVIYENLTDGTVHGGILYRVQVNHSTRQVRMQVYPSSFEEGYTTADAHHYVYYGTGSATWQRYSADGPWLRTDRGGGTYLRDLASVDVDPETVRRSEAVVRRETETAVVVEITDGPALDAVGDPDATGGQLLFVVEKGPSPHLARVQYTARNDDLAIEKTVVVSGVDATPIDHPDELPRARATGAFERTLAGVERILRWLL